MFACSFLLLSTLLKGLVETSVKSEGKVMPRSKRGASLAKMEIKYIST